MVETSFRIMNLNKEGPRGQSQAAWGMVEGGWGQEVILKLEKGYCVSQAVIRAAHVFNPHKNL